LKVSIVIPSYNGWNKLEDLCLQIKSSLLLNYKLEDFEIIIVDDGSRDRSETYIKKLRDTGINVKGVFLNKNYGQQFATLAGLKVSGGEFVLSMDDDLSHRPEDILRLITVLEEGEYDAVFGLPKKSRSGLFRNVGSQLRDIIFTIFFKMPKELSVSSFRVLRRSLVNMIISDISEFRYLSVEILKHTKAIANEELEYKRDKQINSRYSFIKLANLAFSLIQCSSIFPERIRKSETAAAMEWTII
jgi:polyisoprenyl-phosphate glycosyltransferase